MNITGLALSKNAEHQKASYQSMCLMFCEVIFVKDLLQAIDVNLRSVGWLLPAELQLPNFEENEFEKWYKYYQIFKNPRRVILFQEFSVPHEAQLLQYSHLQIQVREDSVSSPDSPYASKSADVRSLRFVLSITDCLALINKGSFAESTIHIFRWNILWKSCKIIAVLILSKTSLHLFS